MHTNISHDLYINKEKSLVLEEEVATFLKAKGLNEPVQIPTGQTIFSKQQKSDEWTSNQAVMRQTMTISISRKRPLLDEITRPLTSEEQRFRYNHNAKHEALARGETIFMGRCNKHGETEYRVYESTHRHHCITCKKIIHERRKKEKAANHAKLRK